MPELTLQQTAPGEGLIHFSEKDGLQRCLPCYWAVLDHQIQLWVNGDYYQLPLPEAKSGRHRHTHVAGLGAGEIHSPMPGTILQIKVKPGDVVTAGQPLLIMESMKMEMTLTAPDAGIVKSVHCTEKQLVEMAALLIHLSENN